MRHTARRLAPAFATIATLAISALAPGAAAGIATKALPTKSVEIDGVTVEATPKRFGDNGARIEVVLDTHEVELDANLRRESKLTVDGAPWPTTGYEGDGPGGHHREGILTFEAGGPARGRVRLVIGGLERRATLRWRLR